MARRVSRRTLPISGEAERAEVLRAYGIELLEDDPELVAIVRFAAHLCEAEVALISLARRRRASASSPATGSRCGETPRSISFCTRTMMLGDLDGGARLSR